MKPIQTLLAWLLAVLALPAAATAAAGPPPPTTNGQVIVYYFHGTVRCETCQKIERQAQAAISQLFTNELATQRLRFSSVNYDLPENRAYLEQYRLPCPSLVVVRQGSGPEPTWKLLGEAWEQIENPEKFRRYVEGEVRKMLPKTR